MTPLGGNLMFGLVGKQPCSLDHSFITTNDFKNMLFRISIIGLILLLSFACTNDVIDVETRAQRLDRQLICPICPGETLDQSNVEVAKQMRNLIRFQLDNGWSEDEVLGFFVDRYGQGILAAPPTSGFNLLVWLVPVVIFPVGLLLLILFVHFNRKAALSNRFSHSSAPVGLDKYLAKVDHEIGLINRRRYPRGK